MRDPDAPTSPTTERDRSVRGAILVVDDEPLLLRAFSRVLMRAGHEVIQACDGAEAAALVAQRRFDCAFVDLGLPGAGGLEVLASLRACDPALPVVLMTGAPTLETAIDAVAAGALRYLVKPIDTPDLHEAAVDGIRMRRREDGDRYDRRRRDERANVESFERALASLYMVYQPIVRWGRREVYAYEALVRTREPSVPHPGALLEIAQRLDRLPELGRRIRAAVAATAADSLARLFVNLHPVDLLDDDLYDPQAPLSRHARRVVLEVTERAGLEAIGDLGDRLRRLRALGYRVAIDDLGEGYAGLAVAGAGRARVRQARHVAGARHRRVAHAAPDRVVDAAAMPRARLEIVAEGVETPARARRAGRHRPRSLAGVLAGAPGAGAGRAETLVIARILRVINFYKTMMNPEEHRPSERTERELRVVIDLLPVGILVRRSDVIVYVNRAIAASYGVEPATLAGRGVVEMVRPEYRDGLARRMAATDGGEIVVPWEFRFDRADGRVGTMEVSAAHHVHFGGAPSVMVTWRDVTDERALRDRLLMADRMAAVGTLASGVAHEINNPLACVTANLELLREELAPPAEPAPPTRMSPEEMLAALDDAREGAERVRLIVRDLRLFARGDAAERGPVDLGAVLQAAERMAGNMVKARARVVQEHEPLPPVDGNATRLCQVFVNILVNAAQAIAAGAPEDNEVRVRAALDGDQVVVDVRDTGVGISADVRARIFNPFFSTRGIGGGVGLGLSVCHGIVSSFGGQISVDDAPGGRGTVVRVALPVYAR